MKNDDIKSLIKYCLEQAQTAIDDARFLLEGNCSPQSIVNRAYYAMFYSVLALLQSIGKVPSKHSGVISLFDTEFVLNGVFSKELSKAFHKAFELRQVSDYKTFKTISKKKAEEALNNAIHYVEVVTKYLTKQVKL